MFSSVCVCVHVWVGMCHGSCVETMGQLAGVSFVLPPRESGLLAYVFTHRITLLAPGHLFWLSFVLGAGDKGQSNSEFLPWRHL